MPCHCRALFLLGRLALGELRATELFDELLEFGGVQRGGPCRWDQG
jgi:hypothetical protein